MGWLYHSNLHISFVAAGVVMGSYAFADERSSFAYVILAAAGALLVYHTDRAVFNSEEDKGNAPHRLEWYGRHRSYLIVSTILAILGIGVSVFILPVYVLISGAILGVLGLLYAAPLFNRKLRLKNIPIVKSVLILFCWVGGGLVLPLWGSVSATTLVLFALYRCLYLLPNLLLAEWVDSPGDTIVGIRSMGASMSIRAIRITAVLSFLGAVACSITLIYHGVNSILLAVDMIGFCATIWMINSISKWSTNHIVWLDLLVGFPAITWLVYSVQ